jgi:Asp-tRNA(Asn)/Glu-tRNA(Gln) amidotransferase A subunit family amidase
MTVAVDSLTIEGFSRKLRQGKISASGVTEACLDRIEAEQPRLNAFILVMADEARRQARDADREIAAGIDRGPLHGVPIAIKDLFDVRGTPTTAASRVREGHVAERDAPVIAHLRQAGAVFIGKTNLHEFAFGATNEDSAYGPARNPHDPARSPGGSSGGSAASLVAGMALGALGTDTGGSVRIPAAACGVVGLKPSYGDISTDGVIPLSPTLDHAGPMTHTVADACVLYRGMVGPATPQRLAPRPRADAMRLALLREYFCDLLDDEVRARFEEALGRLRAAGMRIDAAAVPSVELTSTAFVHIQGGDAAAYHAATIERCPERYTAPVRRRIELGRTVLAEDYVRALSGRERLRQEVDAALAGHDALVLPSLAIPAPRFDTETMQTNGGPQPVRPMMLRLTQLFNLTGHPAISIPCGRTADGLPCGFQLVGRRGQTEALLQVALACEAHIVPNGNTSS